MKKSRLFLVMTVVSLLCLCVACDKAGKDEPDNIKPGSNVDGKTSVLLNSNENAKQEVNSVFLSLSDQKMTLANRESWDLAFYCGKDHNRVRLNNTKKMIATLVSASKSKIQEVTLADAEAIRKDFSLNVHGGSNMINFDPTEGDITQTLFSEVSENTDENKVYFVVTEAIETDKNEWYRVKVDRKGDKYILQYAKIKDEKINVIEIQKDAAFNFIFVSLSNGKLVSVEPEKDKWDIEYTGGLYKTNMTGHGKEDAPSAGFNPYFMKDLVFVNNLANVSVAQVEVSKELSYDNITLSKAKSLNLESRKDLIADKWRSVFDGIYHKYFYLIKDVKGDYYKLKFLRAGMKDDGGVRGCPEVEFAKIEDK